MTNAETDEFPQHDETTLLIPKQQQTAARSWTGLGKAIVSWIVNVENRILFAGFLITLSFSFTQVPYVAWFSLSEVLLLLHC